MAKKSKPENLKQLVGEDVYSVWIKMLKALVLPSGRTHRLSVLVGAMLQYAAKQCGSDRKSELCAALIGSFDGLDVEGTVKSLGAAVKEMFRDAGVSWERVNSKGEKYSVLRAGIEVFLYWYNMPWEQ